MFHLIGGCQLGGQRFNGPALIGDGVVEDKYIAESVFGGDSSDGQFGLIFAEYGEKFLALLFGFHAGTGDGFGDGLPPDIRGLITEVCEEAGKHILEQTGRFMVEMIAPVAGNPFPPMAEGVFVAWLATGASGERVIVGDGGERRLRYLPMQELTEAGEFAGEIRDQIFVPGEVDVCEFARLFPTAQILGPLGEEKHADLQFVALRCGGERIPQEKRNGCRGVAQRDGIDQGDDDIARVANDDEGAVVGRGD